MDDTIKLLLKQTNYSRKIIHQKLKDNNSIEQIIEDYLKPDIKHTPQIKNINVQIMDEIRNFCDLSFKPLKN
tara:strand:+ start:420 stop:635 length:216 start_codon:yes stop_codon:yes gene_type:complete